MPAMQRVAEEYLGNDEGGQMSAWYVFAPLGFYPVDPVSNFYALCTPIFDNVVLRLENNKIFRIVSHRKKPNAFFIQKTTLNGKPYNKKILSHSDIVKGGSLKIYLSETAVKSDCVFDCEKEIINSLCAYVMMIAGIYQISCGK